MSVITDPVEYLTDRKLVAWDYPYGEMLPGCEIEKVYQYVTVGYDVNQHYSDEHRVKPVNPMLSPTSREPIKRQRIRYAYGEDCGGVWKCMRAGRVTRGMSATASISDIDGTAPLTNWETKARLQIKNRSINLAETVFEYRETANMFKAAADGVKFAWDVYRKKTLRLRKLRPSDVAAAELVSSFGINPLLGTLYDSHLALQERLTVPLRMIVRGGAKGESEGSYQKLWWNCGEPGNVTWKWTRLQRFAFVVRFLVEPPVFTMGNPIELAWELIPFSWLIDGLIDVGSYLASIDALKGVDSIIGTVTTRDRKSVIAKVVTSPGIRGLVPGIATELGYQRDVYYTIPMGTIQYKPSKSWYKVMHAVDALIMMKTSGKKRGFLTKTDSVRF